VLRLFGLVDEVLLEAGARVGACGDQAEDTAAARGGAAAEGVMGKGRGREVRVLLADVGGQA